MRGFVTCMVAGLLAAGCAAPMPDRAPAPEPQTAPTRPEPQPMNSPAVMALSSDARDALGSGQYDEAAQFLERAIRIEPQNGALWHQLARVRFEQGDYEQARQLATRSNALLNTGSKLKSRNDELIEASRNAVTE